MTTEPTTASDERGARMRRIALALAVTVTVAPLTACASAGSTDPGCGECVEELARVREEIEGLPDVSRVKTLDKHPASPTNGAEVAVELRTRSTGDEQVVEDVARVVWQSDLVPVGVVTVSVVDASGELRHGASPYDFRDDAPEHEAYERRWGPRPVA